MTKLEKFNRKYPGGWRGVMERREQGKRWVDIAQEYHLSHEYLIRLNKEFSKIDSLSGGEK